LPLVKDTSKSFGAIIGGKELEKDLNGVTPKTCIISFTGVGKEALQKNP
jgi:hypothetical protein